MTGGSAGTRVRGMGGQLGWLRVVSAHEIAFRWDDEPAKEEHHGVVSHGAYQYIRWQGRQAMCSRLTQKRSPCPFTATEFAKGQLYCGHHHWSGHAPAYVIPELPRAPAWSAADELAKRARPTFRVQPDGSIECDTLEDALAAREAVLKRDADVGREAPLVRFSKPLEPQEPLVAEGSFEALLHRLCGGVTSPAQHRGRPRKPVADVIFAAVLRSRSGLSSRRAMASIEGAHEAGLLVEQIASKTLTQRLNDPKLTDQLRALIRESATPLAGEETLFEVRSAMFETQTYEHWFDSKRNRDRRRQRWIKVDLCIGADTHVVNDVIRFETTDRTEAVGQDSVISGLLLSKNETAQNNEILCKMLAHNLSLVAAMDAEVT